MAHPQADAPDPRLYIQKLWSKYEDIAMHFNDLLMRLRSQSLAGVAAISTVVGIFTRAVSGDSHDNWLIATCIFTAAAMFWVAIWCLDFLYYNRLLLGAVTAIKQLEAQSSEAKEPEGINMSTLIEEEFSRPLEFADFTRFRGVLSFYAIVLAVMFFGASISLYMYLHDP